jgi:hypothetical protein
MVKVKKAAKKSAASQLESSTPKYPYTTTIGALRKVLQGIPQRPKPTKVNFALLESWGTHDNNARTVLTVLKELNLIDTSGAPTEHYINYMRNDSGGATLADRIRATYAELFEASHEPYKETQQNLKNLFNIHSGGGERTIQFQIATFKTLCEFADFDAAISNGPPANLGGTMDRQEQRSNSNVTGPVIHINLHIHLPENKSRADYEEIVKDIAKYIYGK